ncbi:hypothetical protein Hanom_Chr02g00169141 [Helianthus anomalus]
MNSINLSKTAPPLITSPVSSEHVDDDDDGEAVITPPLLPAPAADCLEQRKKFREPNSFNFSSLDNPETYQQQIR